MHIGQYTSSQGIKRIPPRDTKFNFSGWDVEI